LDSNADANAGAVPVALKLPPLELTALLVSAICTLCIFGWFMWLMRFGIDFADEGFYLNWISNPFNYKASISQFGYIYHPIFKTVSGDIALLRQVNLFITFSLALTLTIVFLSTLYGPGTLNISTKIVVSAAIAVSSLCFYRNWIPTPNYNFLAFQSLMLAMTGMLLIERNGNAKSIIGWLLLGFSGWLAFMAKPTTAASLLVVSLAYLFLSGKFSIRLAVLSVFFVLLLFLLFALAIDNSVFLFFSRLRNGVKLSNLLTSDYSIGSLIRIDSFNFQDDELIYLIAGSAFLAIFLRISGLAGRFFTSLWFALYLAISMLVLLTLKSTETLFTNRLWVHLLMLLFPMGSLIFSLSNTHNLVALIERIKKHRFILLPLILFPYVFAFGTGGNYWFYYGLVSLFWILGCLFFIDPINSKDRAYPILSFGLAVQLITPLIILTAIEDPYYQPSPLRNSDHVIDFGLPGSKLTLPAGFGSYISQAVEVAKRAGYPPGTPMIDLTGRSPGLLYALGAPSIGSAWLVGNYSNTNKGAEKYVSEVLWSVACDDVARAWILLEPLGQVSISETVLKSIGAVGDRDYEVVGEFETPNSAGGFVASSQLLLKPKRAPEEAINECVEHRKLLRSTFG
jgi:hypothetical protein